MRAQKSPAITRRKATASSSWTRWSSRTAAPRLRLRVPYRAPDALRGQRHVDMRDAVFGERIDDGIDDGGETAGAAGFAAAFGAQWIGFGGHRMIADRHDRNVFGARQRIVHERAGDWLAV